MKFFNKKWPKIQEDSLREIMRAELILNRGEKPLISISTKRINRQKTRLLSFSDFSFVTSDGQVFELFEYDFVMSFKVLEGQNV
jgi:hypothetical protein